MFNETSLQDVDSFIAHIKKYGGDDVAIFGTVRETFTSFPRFSAVYDYSKENARTVDLIIPFSSDFNEFYDRVKYGTEDFIKVIKDRINIIQEPPDNKTPEDAVFMELAKRINGTFMTSSQLLKWSYQPHNSDVSNMFMINVRVFQKGSFYRTPVMFKCYNRPEEDRLSWNFGIYRPDHLINVAFEEVLSKITEETGIIPYRGVVLKRYAKDSN